MNWTAILAAAAIAGVVIQFVMMAMARRRAPVIERTESLDLTLKQNGAAGQVAAAAYRWYLDTIESQRQQISDLRTDIAGVRLELEESEAARVKGEEECDRRLSEQSERFDSQVRDLHERIGRLTAGR